MSKKEFDSFLKTEERTKKPAIDWNIEKKKWLAYLDVLFSDVKKWLKEYVDTKQVNLEFKDLEIYEEPLGAYKVKSLKISIGDKIAQLTPIGTILLGTRGRVDLSGRSGTVKFILAGKNSTGPKIEVKILASKEEKQDAKNKKSELQPQIDWVWKITSNPPRIEYTELNQDTFLQCLLEVIK